MALQQIPAATTGNVWKYYSTGANTTANLYGTPKYVAKVNGYWFITTEQGFILYSSDAKSWTRWASTGTEAITGVNGVIYGNGIYVIYADSGYLFSASTLGGTLTSRTSQFGGDAILDGVYMAGSVNLFIIVGSNGYVSTSADGATWTARTGNQSTNQIQSIAVNDTNDLVILAARGGVANNASYSSNGTSWTTFSPDNGSTADSESQIFYDAGNSKWFYLRDQDLWYESTTPTSGTWTTVVAMPISTTNSGGNTSRLTSGGSYFMLKDSTNNKLIIISRLDGQWVTIHTIDPTVSISISSTRKSYKVDNIENLRIIGQRNIQNYLVSSSVVLGYDSGVFVGVGEGTLAIISNV